METLVSSFVVRMCQQNDWEYMDQATRSKISNKWGKEISVKKSSRKIDFAVVASGKLFLIEVNFYGGNGSKLKSTAGEYKTDYLRWKNDGHQFVWVTDGDGWTSAHRPLRETFDVTDYVFNIDMLEKGILEAVILSA